MSFRELHYSNTTKLAIHLDMSRWSKSQWHAFRVGDNSATSHSQFITILQKSHREVAII